MNTTQDREKLLRIADQLKDKFKFLSKKVEPTEKEVAKVTEHHINIDSESEREAVDLFDNLAPTENKKQPQKKVTKKEQRPKPVQEKPKPVQEKPKESQTAPKESQNSIRSILRQRVEIDEEKPVVPEQPQAASPADPSEQEEEKGMQQEEKEMQQEEGEEGGEQRKGKSVSFNFDENLIFSLNANRKWKDPIENQKKGKFDIVEQRLLIDAIGQYLAANEIKYDEFVQWLSFGSREEKHILRREKFFKLLAGVLPYRSPMSCYRFVLRNYNSFNHQGEWTPEDVERLLNLVGKYGRQWVRIGKEMGRTSDNVYDKYRAIGEEGMEERVKSLWKFRELVVLLLEIEKQTEIEFIDHNIQKELQSEGVHDTLQAKELKEHRYNSKQFTFHNIEVLRKFTKAKLLQGVQLESIKWKRILRKIPSKSHFDCRNKFVQIMNILFVNNATLDEGLAKFLQRERPTEQAKLDWKRWRFEEYTAEQAKNRFMILKKLVEGRTLKPFKQVCQEVILKIKKILEKPKDK